MSSLLKRCVLCLLAPVFLTACKDEQPPAPPDTSSNRMSYVFDGQHYQYGQIDFDQSIGTEPLGTDTLFSHTFSHYNRTLQAQQVVAEFLFPKPTADFLLSKGRVLGKKLAFTDSARYDLQLRGFAVFADTFPGGYSMYVPVPGADTTQQYYRFNRIELLNSSPGQSLFVVEGELKALMKHNGVVKPLTEGSFRFNITTR